MIKKVGTIIFILNLTSNAKPGDCGFTFLKLGVDARATAMGCAVSADLNGGNSIFWNPAGIGIPYHQITSTYLNYIMGIKSGTIGYSLPIGSSHGFGAGLSYLNYGEIQETTPENPTGEGLGTYSASDLMITLGYRFSPAKPFSIGMSFKSIYEKIHEYSGMAIAIDFGFLYQTPFEGLSTGIVVCNLGFQNKPFIKERAPLPLLLEMGLIYKFLNNSFLFGCDLGYAIDSKFYFEIGAEYLLKQILSFRIGYRSPGGDLKTGSDMDIFSGTSAGIGIIWKRFSVDYAFVPYNELGNAHRISLSIGL